MRNLMSLLALWSPFDVVRRAALEIDTRSDGCGTEQRFAGESKSFEIESSGGTRTYLVHLPANYQADDPHPLIVAYHGAAGDSEGMEGLSGFSNEALNPNMISVYPRGIKKSWQGPSYAKPGVDDGIFTTDLINEMKSTFCIDTTRIYAAGFSNGGGFVGTLACSAEHGKHFAAFGAVEGAFYTDATPDANCQPARTPLPILEVHSSRDGLVYYQGGEGRGGPLPAIPDWLDWWAERNGCGENMTSHIGEYSQHIKWDCDGDNDVLQHYKTDVEGHYWQYFDSGFETTSVLMDYFRGHTLK